MFPSLWLNVYELVHRPQQIVLFCPWRGPFGKGWIAAHECKVVSVYCARFHKFSYSSSNFSMATVMLFLFRDLSGRGCQTHVNEVAFSAVARLSAISNCVSHHGQYSHQTFLLAVFPFVIVLSFLGLILKLTSDVLDWIVLWTSSLGLPKAKL